MSLRKQLNQLAIAGLLSVALAGTAHAIDVGVDAGIGGISADVGASTGSGGSVGAGASVGVGGAVDANASAGLGGSGDLDASVSTGTTSVDSTNSIDNSVNSNTQVNTGLLSDFMAQFTTGLTVNGQNTVGVSINGNSVTSGSTPGGGTSSAQLQTAFQSLSGSNQRKILDECDKALANPTRANEAKRALCSLIR